MTDTAFRINAPLENIIKGAGIEIRHSRMLKSAKKRSKGTMITIDGGREIREHFIPTDIADKVKGFLDENYTADYVLFAAPGGYAGGSKVTLEIREGNEVVYRYSNVKDGERK